MIFPLSLLLSLPAFHAFSAEESAGTQAVQEALSLLNGGSGLPAFEHLGTVQRGTYHVSCRLIGSSLSLGEFTVMIGETQASNVKVYKFHTTANENESLAVSRSGDRLTLENNDSKLELVFSAEHLKEVQISQKQFMGKSSRCVLFQ